MGQMNLAWSTCLALSFISLLPQSYLQAAQQKRSEDSPKFGNGALLRRMFGDSETAKQNAENARTKQKEAFEATRQRIASDTERLKEKLGFKPAEDGDKAPAADPKTSRSNTATEPRAQFAPQPPNRLSITDQSRNLTPATPTAGNARPQTPMSRTNSASGTGLRPPGGLPTPNVLSPSPVPRLAISDDPPGPRNQPRVPSQPTFAAPPTTPPLPSYDVEDPKPTPVTFGAFGIIVDTKASGLLIKAVKPKSVAAHIGLRQGDTIKNVAGLDVTGVEEIDSLVEVLEPEDEFEITYIRDGKPTTESFSVPAK